VQRGSVHIALQQEHRKRPRAISQEIPMLAVITHSLIAPAIDERSDMEPGILTLVSRMVHAIHAANQRRLERQIGEYVEVNGGRITDDLERRIGQHFC
jgi:hypothetical protein